MKLKTLLQKLILCVLATGVLLSSATVSAETKDEIHSAIDGVIEFKLQSLGLDSEKELADALIKDLDSTANPWYLIGLSRYLTQRDFSSALDELENYVSAKDRLSTTDRLKLSLLCSALTNGKGNDFIRETLELDVNSGGITNRIYLLLLLDSGNFQSQNNSRENLISLLLDEANADGGWALNGTVSDTDVTAMAIQALAPYRDSNEAVNFAVEKALLLLSGRQNPTGDFSSWGTNNSESAAQVICALCALDLDPLTDSRFIKDSVNLLDGLLRFKLEDGSFAHTEDGKSNDISTSQALYSLVALKLQSEEKDFLFRFNSETEVEPFPSQSSTPEEETTQAEETSEQSVKENEDNENSKQTASSYKLTACAVIAVLFTAVGAFLLFKGRKKSLLPLLITAVILCALVFLIKIESVEEHYSNANDVFSRGDDTVFFSINASQALGIAENVPSDGWFLEETELLLKENETVYDLLCRAARLYKLQLEHSNGSYIKGINHLYEFDCGETSGWSYKVNGVTTSLACCDFVLKDGDKVEWLYVLEPERNMFSQ